MDPDKAASLLKRQLSEMEALKGEKDKTRGFFRWYVATSALMRRTFGEYSPQVKEFTRIRFSSLALPLANAESAVRKSYLRGLKEAQGVLSAAIDTLSGSAPHR